MLAVGPAAADHGHLEVRGDRTGSRTRRGGGEAALLATLGGSASAVLCDPIWAYPLAWDGPGPGAIVTPEDHWFEDGRGRLAQGAILGWSVEKIKPWAGTG